MFKDIFKTVKPATIILIFSVCVFVGATALLFLTLKKERREKISLENELTQVMKARNKLSHEMDELKLIKGDLEVKLSGLEAQTEMLAENYEKEKSQNDVVRKDLRKKEEELEYARIKLETAMDENVRLQEELDTGKYRYTQLRDRIDKLVEVKELLEDKVRDIVNKQGVELERIVVKAEGQLAGKILVVNKEYNFVVVNIGIKDDIELGDVLTVFRNGKYVGEANIEKIYDTMSAATIARETKTGSILVDDNVIVRGN